LKLLYFTIEELCDMSSGVCKKCISQIEVFRNAGFHVDVVYAQKGMLCIEKNHIKKQYGRREKNIFRGLENKEFLKEMRNSNYNGIFIRYPGTDFLFERLIKFWKRSGAKIIIEIPTYPYDAELQQGFIRRVRLLNDVIFRNGLKKYVDYIVTYSMDSKIYNIPTIKTINGINTDQFLTRTINNNKTEIHMIAVASMEVWHGYDRILYGMSSYYKKNHVGNVYFHLVGEGPEIVKYKNIVSEERLEDYVFFYGNKSGEELNVIYNKCDLAVSSLAAHKINIHHISALKTREYALKGLPIITAPEIDIFQSKEYSFILKIEENNSPVDIKKVCIFYDSLYIHSKKSKKEIAEEIRSIAIKKCDIVNTMTPIIDKYRELFMEGD